MPRQPVYLEVEGIGEVKRLLSGATVAFAKNASKRLFTGFAASVRNDLRQAAPVRAGKLKGAIKSKSTKAGGAKVYAAKPEGAHAHIVRKGTKDRKTKAGANRGAMPANARMQAVLDAAPERFRSEVGTRVIADIKKQVEKGLRK